MRKIKNIETEYNGYLFRSRLEARWAVFFDGIDVEYQYEPEGFKIGDDCNYLPDFYLPDYNIFVEVKPKFKAFIKHHTDGDIPTVSFGKTKYGLAMEGIVGGGYGYWIVSGDPVNAFVEGTGKYGNTLNDLFCLCECKAKNYLRHNLVESVGCKDHKDVSSCTKEEWLASGKIEAFGKDFVIWDVGDHYAIYVPTVSSSEAIDVCKKDERIHSWLCGLLEKTVSAAYKARQARFEFGETPKPKNSSSTKNGGCEDVAC